MIKMMRLELYQHQTQIREQHPFQPEDPQQDLHRYLTSPLPSNGKRKNELCKNYLQHGYCRYHGKCQFAHGIEELRQSQGVNIKYKTKLCQSFLVKGCCPYGERCNFLHSSGVNEATHSEIYVSEKSKWKLIKSNFREVIEQARTVSRFFSGDGQ